MDYEFRRSLFDGGYSARFSMEHQVIGRWVIEELGSDMALYQQIMARLEAHQNGAQFWQLKGKELTLLLEEKEVTIQANELLAQQEFGLEPQFELIPELELYDSESVAVCGIEDFIAMLQSWRAFVGMG